MTYMEIATYLGIANKIFSETRKSMTGYDAETDMITEPVCQALCEAQLAMYEMARITLRDKDKK